MMSLKKTNKCLPVQTCQPFCVVCQNFTEYTMLWVRTRPHSTPFQLKGQMSQLTLELPLLLWCLKPLPLFYIINLRALNDAERLLFFVPINGKRFEVFWTPNTIEQISSPFRRSLMGLLLRRSWVQIPVQDHPVQCSLVYMYMSCSPLGGKSWSTVAAYTQSRWFVCDVFLPAH